MLVTITSKNATYTHSSTWYLNDGSARRPDDFSTDAEVIAASTVNDLVQNLLESSCTQHRGDDPSTVETGFHTVDFGEYHPRAYRQCTTGPIPPIDMIARTDAVRYLDLLFAELQEVFKVVYPDDGNQSAYGDRIRQLLLLCAMEVETQFRSVLKENGRNSSRKWNVTDFKALEPLLGLSDYWIDFPAFPLLSKREPFKAFATGQTPGWWTAYNKVKHDRERELREGTIAVLLDALAAVAVICYAQFGAAGPFHRNIGVSARHLYWTRPDGKWTPKPFFA